jgi:enamine deaminase RidA (YjgF/YER057c/UK114 family)
MASAARERLRAAGLELPTPPRASGAYVQTLRVGDLLYTSGQVAIGADGLVATGKVGQEVTFETAVSCAQTCALNVLAQLESALGNLDRIAHVVKLTVFVASAPGFVEQHLVANGASELFAQVLNERGAHCRSAVGVAVLPLDSPVEVEAIVQVSP